MNIILHRSIFTDHATLGTFTIDDGEFRCFTCEDVDRKLETDGVKIHGETCIPRGEYAVVITFSNRFQRQLPLLVGVPGFEGIRIHPGNTAADTEGCILPGLEIGKDSVLHSRDAFAAIFTRLSAAIERGEAVSIEVT